MSHGEESSQDAAPTQAAAPGQIASSSAPSQTGKSPGPRESGNPPAPMGAPGAPGPTEPVVQARPITPDASGAAAEPGGVSADPGGAATEPGGALARGPRMVRRVVCSYRLGRLPADWLQTWRRLDRALFSANLNVSATLAPLEALPADTDILVIPPDLREAASEAAKPGTPLLVTPAAAAAGAFNDLVTRLHAGLDFTAERKEQTTTT